jgi:hypothetical protein
MPQTWIQRRRILERTEGVCFLPSVKEKSLSLALSAFSRISGTP